MPPEAYEKFFQAELTREKETYYNQEAFKEIEPAFLNLVRKLRTGIEEGKFDFLISDDVDGRIVTLALKKIIQRLNSTINPQTFFFPSRRKGDYGSFLRSEQNKRLAGYLSEAAKNAHKPLIITEHVHTGDTIRNIQNFLKGQGINDFAVAVLWASKNRRKDGANESTGDVFIGEERERDVSIPRIDFGSDMFSGVEKVQPREKGDTIELRRRELLNSEDVKDAREDVDLLVQKTINALTNEEVKDQH
ncbi:MAG: hypothetical protein AAB631_01160 [Patescibacteria group bacterium]